MTEWTGMRGKFRIKTMDLSYDGTAVWMTGDLEIQSPDRAGQDAAGSDFFVMENTTIKADVADLNPEVCTGDVIDVEHTGMWFRPVKWEQPAEIELTLDCNGKCTEGCKFWDGKFCTDQG